MKLSFLVTRHCALQDISALIKQLSGEKVEAVTEVEEEVEEEKPYIESDYEIKTPG